MKILLFGLTFISLTSLYGQGPIQNFTLTNATDGEQVSLDNIRQSGVVILFTSNTCPFDAYYTERIRTLIDTHHDKIQFILINSCQEPDESIEKMKAAITNRNFHAPYLADKDQAVMNQLGAKKSPTAFLLSGGAGKFKVIYRGAIDDNPQSAAAVTTNFLENAINKMLTGQKQEVADSRVAGCTIRRK